MKRQSLLASIIVCCISATAAVVKDYDPSLLSSNLFTDITRDSKGYLWVATEYGLNKFDGNTFTAYYGDYGREGDLYTSRIVQLYADSVQVDDIPPLWVLFYGALQYYVPEKDAFYTVDASAIPSPAFTTVTRSGDAIMAHSKGAGWYRMEKSENGWRAVRTVEVLPERTKNYFVSYTDKDGITWEGTPRQSLRQISPTHEGARYIALDETWSNGEPIYSVLVNKEGEIYVGQEKNGLRTMEGSYPTLLPGQTITSALTLSSGEVLLGTATQGIYRFDAEEVGRRSGKWSVHIPLLYHKIKSMVEAPDGSVYVGIMEGGVMQLDAERNELVLLDGFSPSNIYVNKLVLDAEGVLWIGHYSGIDRYNTRTQAMEYRSADCKECAEVAQRLLTAAVYDILFEGDKTYIASNKGLFVVERLANGTEHWTQYTMEDGLPSNVICRLLPDKKGHIWMSTFHGLSYFTPSDTEPTFINYSTGNGLKVVSYIRSMGEVLPTGEMVFPDDNGVTVIVPEMLTGKPFAHPIVLSSLFLSGKRVTPMSQSGSKPVMNGAVDEVEQINMSYLDNHITMQFTTLDMRDPASVCYEYRFAESDDGEWHTTQPGINTLTFNDLGYGRHVLLVRAREGSVYSAPRRWILYVRPPFYQSGWAILLYIVMLVITVLSVIHRVHLRQEQRLLREQLQFYINRPKAEQEQPVLLTVKMKGNDQILMEKMMAYISEHIIESEMSVETIADAVGISRAQLQRRVKDITGLSVGTFVRELRLKQAAQLLRQGDVDISQVAYTVGFSAPNVFSTAFKKYFGVSPSEYMKNN